MVEYIQIRLLLYMKTNKILFVVVLYNQQFNLTNVYKSLLNFISSEDVFIWDNSTDSNLNAFLRNSKYNYKYSAQNMGVSHPYNEGGNHAVTHGYNWITFLDQDTYFSNNYLSALYFSFFKYPYIKLFCPSHKLSNGLYLSPVKSTWKCCSLSSECASGKFCIQKYAVINSGMTISVNLFKESGGYNEKVFLDYSDFQFLDRCSKYISTGYCIDSTCLQDFSNNVLNADSLLNRFKLFCKSLKGCEAFTFKSYVGYRLVVLKRLLSLIYRLKKIYPIYIYYKYYLKKEK